MAISYTLDLGAPAAVSEVNAAMIRAADAHHLTGAEPARFDQGTMFLDSGVQVSALTSSPPPFLDPVKEHYGFDPTVDVDFRHNPTCGSKHQDLDMVRLVVAVLSDVDGDALFMFDGELAMLARIAGRLTVKISSDLWRPDMIALLPPHETGDLPNM